MTDTCEKSNLGAEVIPKDAKNEKRPHNANIKSKLTKPELIGFAFIISLLEIKKHFFHSHLAVWIN